jgi:glycosyltransferase involved in cell wall biosynthesis
LKQELVSVIVPVYNVEKYIKACIESILCQTYRTIELLLINDGSSDNSGAICKSYADKDERIRYYEKANGGVSDARNYGISRMKGEYVAFVDSDDMLRPNYIEKMYQTILEHNTDICICNYYSVFEDKLCDEAMLTAPPLPSLPLLGEKLAGKMILATVASEALNKHKFTVVWNKLYHKKIFKNVSFRVGKIHEDEIACHDIFLGPWEVSSINDILYIHLLRSGSIMSSTYSERRLDIADALRERILLYEDRGFRSFLPKTYTQYISAVCEASVRLDMGNAEHKARWRVVKREYNRFWRRVFLCMPSVWVVALYYLTLFFPGFVWRVKKKWRSRLKKR